MTDDVSAWQLYPVVSPDGSSAVAETSFGSFVFEGKSGPLPGGFMVSIVESATGFTPFFTFPTSAEDDCTIAMHFNPREEDSS